MATEVGPRSSEPMIRSAKVYDAALMAMQFSSRNNATTLGNLEARAAAQRMGEMSLAMSVDCGS
jgi:hypothetical protein